jgi:uncharacterized membrane protein YeaQ/YmgE (transglycosylase-associated protein family)
MKIFTQFISGLVGSVILGIIGLIIGTIIGGNFGFPKFGGNVGYESGGVFFAIVGISLGSLLGIMFAKKMQKEQHNYILALITAIITTCIGIFLFDYNMSLVVKLTILFIPSVMLTAVTNWRKLYSRKVS